MAKLLGEGGLADEARAPMLEAILFSSRALAVEHRLPEPLLLDDALRAPLSHCWAQSLETVKTFATDPSHPWPPVAALLSSTPAA